MAEKHRVPNLSPRKAPFQVLLDLVVVGALLVDRGPPALLWHLGLLL